MSIKNKFRKGVIQEILLLVGIFAIIGIVLISGCTEPGEQRTSEVLGNSTPVIPTLEIESNPVTPNLKIDSSPAILSEIQTLKLDIDNAPYNTSEYKENIFDCSNMAVLFHDWLETQTQTKWRVQVWFGHQYPSSRSGHEWLKVIGNESNYTIEATSKQIDDQWKDGKTYEEYFSYFNRHYEVLPKGSGGFIDPKENTYPKRW